MSGQIALRPSYWASVSGGKDSLYMLNYILHNLDILEAAKHPEKKWEGTYKTGVKAQYEHARVIAAKLSVEIGKSIKSYYEL